MAGRTLTFSRADFTAAWNNPALSRAEIAALFDMSELHTWRVAQRFGLPRRAKGPRQKSIPVGFVREAWLAGVRCGEICRVAGIVPDTLYARLESLGLERRGPGTRPKMTLAEFRMSQVRKAMAATARAEQEALWNAEMVDGDPRNRRAA